MFNFSEKHSRQIIIPEIGYEGHLKLRNSNILIVGAGGLGIPAGMYLASSGIGRIGIIDDDIIEVSNLGRQIAYSHQDIGKKKAKTLCEKLSFLNPEVNFLPYEVRFSQENALQIAKDYDLIINGSDNLKTRFIINEFAHKLQIPWVNTAVTQFDGQISAYLPNHGCYACLFQNNPPKKTPSENCDNYQKNCATEGILAPLCGMFGSWGAALAMNILLEINTQENIFYHFNSRSNSLKNFTWKKNTSCPVCSEKILSIPNKNYAQSNNNEKNHLLLNVQQIQSLIEKQEKVVFIDLTSYNNAEKIISSKFNLNPKADFVKLNLSDFFSSDLEDPAFTQYLNKEFNYICICEFGVKSQIAAEILHKEGFLGNYLQG